ncbi:DUF3311 domain-containing protein [Streptomyces sp. NPDC020096]
MTEPPPQPKPVITASRLVAAVCLVLPFIATLWVSSYARPTPAFIGIPFFYWYQMAWVVISTGLTSIAYVLIRREERARRSDGSEEAA